MTLYHMLPFGGDWEYLQLRWVWLFARRLGIGGKVIRTDQGLGVAVPNQGAYPPLRLQESSRLISHAPAISTAGASNSRCPNVA